MTNNICRELQCYLGRLQDDFLRLDENVSQHEIIISTLREEVDLSFCKVNSVLAEVDRKMEEFQEWVNYVKPKDVTTEIPMEIVNSLNEIILDKSLASTMEFVSVRVEQLEGVVLCKQQTTEHVRSVMI